MQRESLIASYVLDKHTFGDILRGSDKTSNFEKHSAARENTRAGKARDSPLARISHLAPLIERGFYSGCIS